MLYSWSLSGLGGKFRLPVGVPQLDQQPLDGVVLQCVGPHHDGLARRHDREEIRGGQGIFVIRQPDRFRQRQRFDKLRDAVRCPTAIVRPQTYRTAGLCLSRDPKGIVFDQVNEIKLAENNVHGGIKAEATQFRRHQHATDTSRHDFNSGIVDLNLDAVQIPEIIDEVYQGRLNEFDIRGLFECLTELFTRSTYAGTWRLGLRPCRVLR